MIRAKIKTLTGSEKLTKVDDGIYSLEGNEYWITRSDAKEWLKDKGIHWKRIKSTDMEKRLLTTEFRELDGNNVEGYAALFNTLSEDLGGFKERIAPGAFEGVENDDIRALMNHDPNLILGRTTAGTLQVEQDEKGFRYRYSDPETTYSQDLRKSMKRGDVNQSSFAFSVKEDNWEEVDDVLIRTIIKFERLYDVSPVTYPAYPDTTVATRSMEMIKADKEKTALDEKRKKDIEKEQLEREQILRNLTLSGLNK